MIAAAFGIVLPLAFALAVGHATARRTPGRSIRRVVWLGLVLRLLGGLVYLGLHEGIYGGGDYSLYTTLAFGALGHEVTGIQSPVLSAYGGVLNGTSATAIATWWVSLVIGRSTAGLFLVFATVNFAGAAFFGAAFERAFPEVDPISFYRWVMLFPSLWFWPSALGKDALILAGLGLATLGFVGHARRRWPVAVAGLAVVFVVRVSYVVLAAAALALGGLVGRNRRSTELQWVMTFVVVALGAYYALPVISDALGFSVTDVAEAVRQIDRRADASAYGGSSFEPTGNPVWAVVTGLFRPFPWEASGVLMWVASAEVLLLWGLVLRRRRAVVRFLRDHWRSEFVVLSAAFVVALALLVGLAVGNFGTIVRQRVHLYPFLFVVVAGYARRRFPRRATLRRRPPTPRRLPVPA